VHKYVHSYVPHLTLPCSWIVELRSTCLLQDRPPPCKVWHSLFCFHLLHTKAHGPPKNFLWSPGVSWTPGWEPLV